VTANADTTATAAVSRNVLLLTGALLEVAHDVS